MIQSRTVIYRLISSILILSLLFTSCAIRLQKRTQPEPERTESAEKEQEKKQAPSEKEKEKERVPSRKTQRYRLGFGDVIEVKFFNNERFNETLNVRPDGRISMQKVGDILVAGLTPTQLSRLITKIYGKILKNPEVTVIVRNFGGYQVFILGEVNSPGAIPLQRNLTVLQTLAQAGGYKETASLRSVLLMRRNKDGTIDAKRVNLRAKSPEAILKNDLYVEAFDVIYVPKTFIANVNTFLDQALAGLIKPLDVYLRAAWYYGR